jgi:hypothetical protein
MSEQSSETTSTRNFYRQDYERIADILRRARHGMTPQQVSAIGDGAAEYFTTLFTQDNPNFDAAPFLRATLRRIETIDNAAYVEWAIANDMDPNAATANEDAYYAAKSAAQYADSDDTEDDDDSED